MNTEEWPAWVHQILGFAITGLSIGVGGYVANLVWKNRASFIQPLKNVWKRVTHRLDRWCEKRKGPDPLEEIRLSLADLHKNQARNQIWQVLIFVTNEYWEQLRYWTGYLGHHKQFQSMVQRIGAIEEGLPIKNEEIVLLQEAIDIIAPREGEFYPNMKRYAFYDVVVEYLLCYFKEKQRLRYSLTDEQQASYNKCLSQRTGSMTFVFLNRSQYRKELQPKFDAIRNVEKILQEHLPRNLNEQQLIRQRE